MQGFFGAIERANDPLHRATAYNNKGIEYYKKEDYLNAIRNYEAAIQLNPQNSVIRNNLVNALKVQAQNHYWNKDYPSQIAAMERAAQLKPNDEFLRGQLDSAKKAYNKILEDEQAMVNAKDHVSNIFSDFYDTVEAQEATDPQLGFMDFDDPNLSPESTLEKEKATVTARLDEINKKILNAPPISAFAVTRLLMSVDHYLTPAVPTPVSIIF